MNLKVEGPTKRGLVTKEGEEVKTDNERDSQRKSFPEVIVSHEPPSSLTALALTTASESTFEPVLLRPQTC